MERIQKALAVAVLTAVCIAAMVITTMPSTTSASGDPQACIAQPATAATQQVAQVFDEQIAVSPVAYKVADNVAFVEVGTADSMGVVQQIEIGGELVIVKDQITDSTGSASFTAALVPCTKVDQQRAEQIDKADNFGTDQVTSMTTPTQKEIAMIELVGTTSRAALPGYKVALTDGAGKCARPLAA